MLAENYPQLKSDGPMIEAQRTYTEIETNIAAARRFYNASVTSLTNAVQTFPGPVLKGSPACATCPRSSRPPMRHAAPRRSEVSLVVT